MRSQVIRIQLIAFAIVAILGVVYVGGKYVRLDNLLGFGEYNVNAQFKDSGGIFTNAEVTYRGVPIGRVGDLSLTSTGVNVQLKISNSWSEIPASAKAVVANRSAIGEQYVDLQPDSDEGPFLGGGSEIVESNTSTPVPVEQVLMATDTLVKSVPIDPLRTVVTELGAAFNGRGEDLQTLADSLSTLSKDGLDVLPQTLSLIRDSETVLATQTDQSSAIVQFSSDLDAVAAQLRSSDPDIRSIIDQGIPASEEIGKLVNETGPNLTTDLTNLAALSEELAPRAVALRPLLIFLPAIAGAAGTVAPGDGTVHQGLVLETNNPPACTIGYEGTYEILAEMKRQDPNFDDTQQDFPFNTEANCDVPQGSVTGVRSADRIVFADPDTIQPWDFDPKVMPDTLNLNPIATQLAPLLGVTPK
ncbi:MCE family protein [Rhodococcus marinonascens]|uniref:MCE family protein n=1 Tax=Rhodococcus marinonascens TaxID=38311 RepID=UPI00093305A1|nr:MlaD family protein [Rhodococcus marinonascens]